MNDTQINNSLTRSLEESEEVKYNCDQLEQTDELPMKVGFTEELQNEEEIELKEEAEKEIDYVEEFLKYQGHFSISLIKPSSPKEDSSTFDVLPLPFLQSLNSHEALKFSLEKEINKKSWRDFLHALPESEYEIVKKPNNKYWRWKMYKKYEPEEITCFRKTLGPGPKLDRLGRPPTPEDLINFRIYQSNAQNPERFKTFLKKGGHKKLTKKNIQ